MKGLAQDCGVPTMCKAENKEPYFIKYYEIF